MTDIGAMTIDQLAGFICKILRDSGIVVTLTGGACVTIWSNGEYVSHDLDFIEDDPVARQRLRQVMQQIGFQEKGPFYAPRVRILCGISQRAAHGRRPAC